MTTIETLAEARAWLEDVFSDLPDNLTDGEIRQAIATHYDGGWRGFLADAIPTTIRKTER